MLGASFLYMVNCFHVSVFLEFSRVQQSKIRFALTFNAYKWVLSLQKLLKKTLLLLFLSINFAFLSCFQLSSYINFIVRPIIFHSGSDMHTHKLKQQCCYTLAYMWVGWTLTCFGCGTGEDIILYKLVSLCIGST